ncbi:MAG: RNA polymerase sigma factor [Vicinamibacterales bacterium]
MDDREATLRRWLADHRGILVRLSRAYAQGPDDEEDLLQEIVLALWRSLPSFRGEARESTWIFQVALQVALSRRRARARRPLSTPLESAPEPAADGQAEAFDRLRWSTVLQALRRLAPVDRAVLLLALEGATQQEIGDVLGVTANAAGVKLHRARRRLTNLLEARP